MNEVLLTGGSGTIGSALVPRLLARSDQRVTLLLRARDQTGLSDKLAQLQSHWRMAADDPRLLRLSALRGDISQPGLGLSAEQQAGLARQCTHIIHCAASVKLNMPLDVARETAVTPTRSILALARQCASSGQLQKVDLVSTVGVWGRTPGAMPERRLPDVSVFHNTYEAAKAEAERVVWSEGDGLPITVHRPSMVVGDSRDGRVVHFQVFYHLCEFLSGGRTFGIMPKLGVTRLDTVPVDWVADVIAWASACPQSAGQILHLCAGPQMAIPITALQTTVRQIWQQSGRTVPTLRTLNRRWLERLVPVIGALAGARTRRALRALPPVLDYLDEDQVFSNTETLRTLHAANLPMPEVAHYLQPVLSHYLSAQTRLQR